MAPRSTTRCAKHYMVGRQLNPFPSRAAPIDGGGCKVGAHVPKAQGLKRRGRGPGPCNTEGVRGVRQTDVPRIIVRRLWLTYIWVRVYYMHIFQAYGWRLVVRSYSDWARVHSCERLQGRRLELAGDLPQSSSTGLDSRWISRRHAQHREPLVNIRDVTS